MGHDWSPRISKAERIDRGERGLLVAFTDIVLFSIAVRR